MNVEGITARTKTQVGLGYSERWGKGGSRVTSISSRGSCTIENSRGGHAVPTQADSRRMRATKKGLAGKGAGCGVKGAVKVRLLNDRGWRSVGEVLIRLWYGV